MNTCFKHITIILNSDYYETYISKSKFNKKTGSRIKPIWELIEKVKNI